jgi:hypothetical protein
MNQRHFDGFPMEVAVKCHEKLVIKQRCRMVPTVSLRLWTQSRQDIRTLGDGDVE